MTLVDMERAPQGKKRLSLEVHELTIPTGCCPVSKNPFPGSRLFLVYYSWHALEVGSILRYLHSFVGGQQDAQGKIVVRDMEGMICAIADEAARCLHTFVVVYADLVILPKQKIHLFAVGIPWRRK